MPDQINIFVGKNVLPAFKKKEVLSEFISIDEEAYYLISNVNELPPFFMSIVSDSNHWMFISSNGGLTAGRKNAEYSLFPYYTEDKLSESTENTGSKSIFLVHRDDKSYLWEPFSDKYEGIYNISRNLYKNSYGNKIIFEEVNHDLQVKFRYQWSSSNLFGFIKKSTLFNDSTTNIKISLLDGIQNIVPYGVGAELQNNTSNLADAYKRSELIKNSGLGIFALSAIIVDKAEPSEALKASIAWSLGLDHPTYLLSSRQLNNFRKGLEVHDEVDIKAEKGSYFVNADVLLSAKGEKEWMIVANVNQSQSSIISISEQLRSGQKLIQSILEDIHTGTRNLVELVASSDGLQLTGDHPRNVRHFSNTLFNIMRGGVFDHNYQLEKTDFCNYLAKANKKLYSSNEAMLNKLSPEFKLNDIIGIAEQSDDQDFRRLCFEYLPLKFSRRHGDPSRPWNRFSINTRSEVDGSKVLDYEGNWRDIFQNWEALARAYPGFAESMIHKFLNASTFDGYNPYRITKDGFDWETIEPDNPWSYIGYWGDHQVIYLLKLLELFVNHHPDKLQSLFNQELFVYANVPYRIKSYHEILNNPKDTIVFDSESDSKVRNKKQVLGADATLLPDQEGNIHHVNFIEKILATVLAKMSNFIPEGGIWMNTQRPEWNDANNALVGNGLSMVTLYYLRRFLHFFEGIFADSQLPELKVSAELAVFFNRMADALDKHKHLLDSKISDSDRKKVLDDLGQAGSDYRLGIYKNAFSGRRDTISLSKLGHFVKTSKEYLEHSIRANKRSDDLYHAYNILTFTNENEISLSYLSEMLEGQVGVLSSGYLSPAEVLVLLKSLKKSKLYRKDQNSYLLYPNKDLPKFLEKNNIPEASVSKSELLKKHLKNGHLQLIEKDIKGQVHFNAKFRNAGDLKKALLELSQTEHASLVEKEGDLVLQIFEEVFNHKAFTGRSGTFFAYEGLGSIYWHMVSKLQLAVLENCVNAEEMNESSDVLNSLINHYYEINEGIGVHKQASVYGAFSTDPYSHTPEGKGVKQPGMTGQVKEDILCRIGEMGVWVHGGRIIFKPFMLKRGEFLSKAASFDYVDIHSAPKQIILNERSLCFTYCQVPVMYKISEKESVEVLLSNNRMKTFDSLSMDHQTSKKIFERTGEVTEIVVNIKESGLKVI